MQFRYCSVLGTTAMEYPNNYVSEDHMLLVALYQNIVVTVVLLLLAKEPDNRAPSLFQQRLQWESFQMKHSNRKDFKRHIRLPSIEAFNKLLDCIRGDLLVD